MKTIITCTAIVGLFAVAATAANITWQTPEQITGASDVSTLGLYFGSWAPQDGSANTMPVNGVTFQGFSDLPSLTPGPNFDNGYNGFNSPGTSDANYNALLQYARFSNENTPDSFSWAGLTVGDSYLVQFWVQDGRTGGEGTRTETLTGGANTSAALNYGSDSTAGFPGDFIIGTFVADSATESLTLAPGGAYGLQINLFQVRDITATPEPSSVALLVIGAGAMVFSLRRKWLAA